MSRKPIRVLFLCTANSARSIMAEAALNALGGGRFEAYSAGSHPSGTVHPLALELIERAGYPTKGLRSKGWDEFSGPRAPRFDFVITVCDAAAGETCPVFLGKHLRSHWSTPDPAMAKGDERAKRRAFQHAFEMLTRRVQRFTSLPFESVDTSAMQSLLGEVSEA